MGYDIALPITESAAYDILVDDNNGIHRVQVRYSGGIEVELRRIHSNSTGYVIKKTKVNAYDWLYILKNDGQEYLIKECLRLPKVYSASRRVQVVNVIMAEREGFEPSRELSPP